MEEYYKPSEIRYNAEQIRWLMRNVLFNETWPSDHKETGYSGSKGKGSGHNAPFTTIREVIGELNARLRLCGKAGLFLEYITLIDYGDTDYLTNRLAGYHGITPGEVTFLYDMALRFCRGRKRKYVSFEYFCQYTRANDNARHKKRGERMNPSPSASYQV